MTEESSQTALTPPVAPSGSPQAGSFKGRAIRASAATIGGYAISQIIRIGSNMVLTRLLFPEAFGLMALVQVILTGLEMISDIGIQPSIVQHKRGDEAAFLNTAWTIQAIRGLVLWVCGALIAIPFAWFYAQPQLVQLIPVTTAVAALSGLNSTKLATLNRRMEVVPLVLIDLAAQLAAIAAMIGIALVHRSVWALVAGGIVSGVVKMALSHLVIPGIRNRIRWEPQAAREIVSFGKWIFVSTLVTFISMRLDIFLLGALLPLEVLGVYSIAGLLSALPQQVAGRLALAVLFPALADAARESRERLSIRLRHARSVLLPAALLTVLGIVLLAPAFFRHLYDERYHSAGWMAQLLMVSIWFQLLHHIAARTLLAVGDSRSLAFSNGVRLLFTIGGCLFGFHIADLPGLILGAAVGSLSGYLSLLLAIANHGLSLGFADLGYSLGGAACGLTGALGPQLLASMLGWQQPEWLELAAAGLILVPWALFLASRTRRIASSAASAGPQSARGILTFRPKNGTQPTTPERDL